MERQFTASCYIFKDEKVLLVHHKKFNKWMPAGGHLDPNETPQEAAIRECLEETGLAIELIGDEANWVEYPNASSLRRPYMCLLENIPATASFPAHQHIDFVFIGRPVGGALLLNATESHDIRWFTQEEISLLTPEDEIFTEVQVTLLTLFKQQACV
jgi:8-oxo-dGTP pyrophosphatase MutT (NUDIX family)